MSVKITAFFLTIFFSDIFARLPLNEKICVCDTEKDIKAHTALWKFLEKLSAEADESKDQMNLFSVLPGLLAEFQCAHCDGKVKGSVTVPEEVEAVEEEIQEEPERKKRSIYPPVDVICPKGYKRYIKYCVPQKDFFEEE